MRFKGADFVLLGTLRGGIIVSDRQRRNITRNITPTLFEKDWRSGGIPCGSVWGPDATECVGRRDRVGPNLGRCLRFVDRGCVAPIAVVLWRGPAPDEARGQRRRRPAQRCLQKKGTKRK